MFDRSFKCFLITLLALLVLDSCGEQNDNQFEPVPYQVFSKLLFTKDISFQELIDYTQQHYGLTDEQLREHSAELAMLKVAVPAYRAYRIAYLTVSPNGIPVEASGVLYYPKHHKVKGVVEVSSVLMDKCSSVLSSQYSPEILPGMLGHAILFPI